MRVLTVSDLHQRRSLFSQLTAAVATHQPDVVALVGDFLDADHNPPAGCDRLTISETAAALAALGAEVVMVRGNHEDANWPEFEAAWLASGRELHALHGSAVTLAGLTIVGFPCLTGNEFHYSQGRELVGEAYEGWLPAVFRRTGPAGRGLWLMHEPPTPELGDWRACCAEWRRAIEEYQPQVVVSGHDHTHALKQGKWFTTLGRTVCVNVGQRVFPKPGRLLYCTIDFDAAGRLLPKGITRHGA